MMVYEMSLFNKPLETICLIGLKEDYMPIDGAIH